MEWLKPIGADAQIDGFGARSLAACFAESNGGRWNDRFGPQRDGLHACRYTN